MKRDAILRNGLYLFFSYLALLYTYYNIPFRYPFLQSVTQNITQFLVLGNAFLYICAEVLNITTMASIEKTLSTRCNENGKRQLYVKIFLSRTIRLRYKSGIYVTPEYWDEHAKSVIVPRLGKLNKHKVEEATKESNAVSEFLNDFTSICNASVELGNALTSDWVTECFAMKPYMCPPEFYAGNNGSYFTASNISKASRMIGELQSKADEQARRKEQDKTIYQLIPEYCKCKNLSPSRVSVYGTLGRMLARYEMFVNLTRDKSFRLSASTISTSDIEDFRDYARNEGSLIEEYQDEFAKILKEHPQTENPNIKNRPINDRGENYIVCTMKRLKAVTNWCLETGRTTNMPFNGVEIGTEKYVKHPIFITKEERNIIADYDLSNKSQIVQEQRDIFILQCFIGCRVSDLYALTEKNISTDNVLSYVPSKTEGESGVTARVPLSDRAISIIEKYKETRKSKSAPLMPFISQQRYNDTIKEIFSICGITREVLWLNPKTGKTESKPINEVASSHMARRTFVGNIYKQVKDPNLIGAMSGHTEGSKAFARYRDIDNDDLRKTIKLID